MADERFIRITLVRSPIGYRKYQRVTAETLGLRKLHATVVHRETPAIRGMVNQIGHLLKVEEVDAPAETGTTSTSKPARQPKPAKQVETAPAKPVAEKAEAKTPAKSSKKSAAGDDLTKIEGVGPKMSSALVAAGIDTYAKLAEATEAQIRSAIEEAGMRLAPGLETWPEQAEFAAKGDWDGLEKLQGRLVGGRRVD
jgi:ribosomal protein L30